MPERNFISFLKALVGKNVTLWTRGGEKLKGTLVEAGQDYVVLQREQMTPLLIPLSGIDAISG